MKNLARLLKYSFPIITLIALTNCGPIIYLSYGIKKIKPTSDRKLVRLADRYSIPLDHFYKLDIAYYDYLFDLDSVKLYNEIKNHYQPLQALYYDKNGKLKSFQINCNAGGFPNITWERDSIFTTFIPKEQTKLDTIMPLDKHLKYLIPFKSTQEISIEDYDYVVIVHWAIFMGRQSKRLIRTVQENLILAENQRVKVLYVNNDDSFNEWEH